MSDTADPPSEPPSPTDGDREPRPAMVASERLIGRSIIAAGSPAPRR